MPLLPYTYTLGRQPLTISARNAAGVREFFGELSTGAVPAQNRWDNAMLFLRCGIDWPAWQELHARTFQSWKAGAPEFYDPWKTTDEFERLCQTEPVSFDAIYQGLSAVPATLATRYVTVAYHSRQILERKSLYPDDVLSFEQLLELIPTGLVAPASSAPIAPLLSRAKSSDLVHCFAQLGLPKAKNMQIAAKYVEERQSAPEVIAALQSSPRWSEMLYLLPPSGCTWERFQDFRFVIKGMAQDFSSYMNGFPIFEER